ncbi:MAG: TlpA disulfide reductase family protein [Armatimonadota bacterium]|nr:TlpA family protein disulfide reductase [Armatimonadota bacterium]MCX7777069.1 TlpA family protein disulfide reductase [Armatimonadota bacterium]MDW8024861.1 TlpA disulfide reductase family protein [Armatimonadota bacterium]
MRVCMLSVIAVAACVFLLPLHCLSAEGEQEQKPVAKVGEQAPDIELKSVDGKQVKLSEVLRDEKTKVVLINFLAVGCPYSQKLEPFICRLFDERQKDGLVVIGIAKEFGNPEAVKAYMERMKVKYVVLLDEGLKVFRQVYGAPNTPTLFIINKQGKLLGKYIGLLGESDEEYYKFLNDAVTAAIDGKELPPAPEKIRGKG